MLNPDLLVDLFPVGAVFGATGATRDIADSPTVLAQARALTCARAVCGLRRLAMLARLASMAALLVVATMHHVRSGADTAKLQEVLSPTDSCLRVARCDLRLPSPALRDRKSVV